jgi:hypothetical protein
VASFCPFVGAECVEEKCKMWRDGDCLIPTFLSTSIVRNIQELAGDEDGFDEDELDDDDLDEDEIDEDDFEDDEDEDEDEEDDEEDADEGDEEDDEKTK